MRTRLCGIHTRYARAYGLGLALALMASLAMDVEAKWARYHALGCMTRDGLPFLSLMGLSISRTRHPYLRSALWQTPTLFRSKALPA